MLKKLAIVASIFLVGRFALKLYLEVHTQIIVDRFPDLPETEVRKAHAEILRRALTDPNFEPESEEELDALMRQLVAEQLRSV